MDKTRLCFVIQGFDVTNFRTFLVGVAKTKEDAERFVKTCTNSSTIYSYTWASHIEYEKDQ